MLDPLVVIGNGMVGNRFLEAAADRGLTRTHRVIVCAEEPRLAYDRVNLSKVFQGKTAEDLSLAPNGYAELGVEVILGDPVIEIDRARRSVRTRSGRELPYRTLVVATGSRPFVPEIPGRDHPRCFVYRTLEDLEAIRGAAQGRQRGVVIGGGLLGLEAAGALLALGLETHVVEFAPRLMPLQVDEAGGAALRARIEELGAHVHLAKSTHQIQAAPDDGPLTLHFADGSLLSVDLVVFSAGIRARDELATNAGLTRGPRGGVAITRDCRTSDPDIFAIGECAAFDGVTFGLVAPGYRMAEVAAAVIAGDDASFSTPDTSTKLKLLGVDVASFGDAFGTTPGSRAVTLLDGVAKVYKKLVVSADKRRLLGGILVGDASAYGELLTAYQNALALPEHPEELLLPPRESAPRKGAGVAGLPDSAILCSCHNVTKGALCGAIRDQKLTSVGAVKSATKAGSGCGSCASLIGPLLTAELERTGVAVSRAICEHFPHSRQELFHLVRTGNIRSFDALLERHGQGEGCEICKPAVASILASTWNDYILDERHAGLQDTNDRFLANIQRDGTYSVVPRVAAGEITPDGLITIGRIAKKYGLYTKLTGGQRIDMFGARLEQLPAIWSELVAAGFESGHAYGKSLRTVKSCVGSTWCRYGVQDSVGLALRLEHRYKGLRSPHKLKGAVSGCARECAEAQSKDFGVIATDKGYNLYLGGNGGMKPQHALLFATDLDEDTLIRYLDRFLMFYVRSAGRLQRTATWLNELEGGVDYLRRVLIEDSLGIAAELEEDMARVIASYQCEWKTTLESPEKLKMFKAFVNNEESDPSIAFVEERGQHRPATWEEKQTREKTGRVRLPLAVAEERR